MSVKALEERVSRLETQMDMINERMSMMTEMIKLLRQNIDTFTSIHKFKEHPVEHVDIIKTVPFEQQPPIAASAAAVSHQYNPRTRCVL